MPESKLLIVDDSATIRKSVQRILDQAGYETLVAADGNEAISCLDQNPDLVVLDVNMPGLDGYGVCEKLRDFGTQFEQLPIVFLTSLESKAMELLGQEYGAYLNKPVAPEELLETVERLLSATQASCD